MRLARYLLSSARMASSAIWARACDDMLVVAAIPGLQRAEEPSTCPADSFQGGHGRGSRRDFRAPSCAGAADRDPQADRPFALRTANTDVDEAISWPTLRPRGQNGVVKYS